MSKKMYPEPTPARGGARVERTTQEVLREVRGFTIPEIRNTKQGMYLEFSAFDPATGKMRRKRIFCNRIRPMAKRRAYYKEVQKKLTEQLFNGWNPFIGGYTEKLTVFQDCTLMYDTFLDKMFNSGSYRRETYVGYKSYLKILREYAGTIKPIYYLYQFDKRYCSDFLDHVFIERNCGPQTRNNYLNFLRVFSGFLLDKGLIESRPTDGISPISKRLYKKKREVIPEDQIRQISRWLYDHDRHFLLACQLLYYCMIRPVELTRLRLEHFHIKDNAIVLPGHVTKSKSQQSVTLPNKIIRLMIDLSVFSHPSDSLLFSNGLCPGVEQIDTIIFRHHWERVREALKLPKVFSFYSLKDSGITGLLDKNVSTIDVRDQARHSSLAITDIYARPKHVRANPDLINFEGDL